MARKTCASVGCKDTPTHVLTYSFPGERDVTTTEQVCKPCGEGYVRRPTLKAKLAPIPGTTGRKRNKLFVWEGVLTDYTSGMAVVLAPSLEVALAIMETRVSEYGMSELRSTKPHVIESLTCPPMAWHVTGGG